MSTSGGGGAGALRVKAKLKAALKNGNFYEAHQMYRYMALVYIITIIYHEIQCFYRETHQVVTNLPLTSKQKLCFGLARPVQARPKQNFCFAVNGRF